MTPKKIIISPLNWGFGHAGRMIPLALELRKRGHEILFCADREVIPMLSRELPGISIIEIPGIRMTYSRNLPQWLSILWHLPHIVTASVREHTALKRLAEEHKPDIIISDNRFGFYHKKIFSAYVTHMIRIPFPPPFRFLEPALIRLHRKIIEKYDLCLIPDFPGDINLSGRLSHGIRLPENTAWTGPLSRFLFSSLPAKMPDIPEPYCCLVLSGPEPQRTILKEKIAAASPGMHLVILDGTGEHNAITRHDNIILISNPDTPLMKVIISGSARVISRSGYTTLMELVSLQKGALIVPTPGQPEQEYLGEYFNGKWGFVTLDQNEITGIKELIPGTVSLPASGFPDAGLLLKTALDRLTEKEK